MGLRIFLILSERYLTNLFESDSKIVISNNSFSVSYNECLNLTMVLLSGTMGVTTPYGYCFERRDMGYIYSCDLIFRVYLL